jgi:hypothetical protein
MLESRALRRISEPRRNEMTKAEENCIMRTS